MMAKKLIIHNPQLITCATLCILIACSKTDPTLPGDRIPVFDTGAPTVLDREPDDWGRDIEPQKCDFTIDGGNRIWKGRARIFAGLPTESEINAPKRVACNGKFVYAGLSTGELVKVDSATRNLEWTADIFAAHAPTGGSHFLDIIAAPVLNGGFAYAGGLGGAFCKIRDSDGAKIWCLPIGVVEITRSTTKFNVLISTENELIAVSTDGKVYWKRKNHGKQHD